MAPEHAERLGREMPLELRVGGHHLYTGAAEYGDEDYPPSDLPVLSDYLRGLEADDLRHLLDAASWLGLVFEVGSGRVQVPHDSVLGLLIRQPRFAAP